MLFRRKETYKEEEFYVKDLYVGKLGYVTMKDYETLSIHEVNKMIIFKKEKLENDDDYCAKNIFTGQIYFFFHGNKYIEDTIGHAINSYAVSKYYPIEMFLDIPMLTISKNDLLDLYRGINLVVQGENQKEELPVPVTDNLLQMILNTGEMVKNSKFNTKLKNQFIEELERLGENYVQDLVGFGSCENVLSFENEYTIKMKYIRKLVEIEENFRNMAQSKTYSLKRELTQFKKNIK